MAVTLTVEQLRSALRLTDSVEETAEATRLLAYATEAVTKHAPPAANVVHDEAVRRLAGYMFDQPEAARGDGYANALRNSGAARILLPYRVHRAGLPGETVAEVVPVPTPGPGGLSLTLVGTEEVNVASADVWYATTIDVPTTDFIGIQIGGMADATDGISIFPNVPKDDVPVTAGDIAVIEGAFAVSRTTTHIAMAARKVGTYQLTIYSLGLAT